MTKAEALKLAIDGKKVRNVYWPADVYLIFNNDSFEFEDGRPYGPINYETRDWNDWEVYEEPKQEESKLAEEKKDGLYKLELQISGLTGTIEALIDYVKATNNKISWLEAHALAESRCV